MIDEIKQEIKNLGVRITKEADDIEELQDINDDWDFIKKYITARIKSIDELIALTQERQPRIKVTETDTAVKVSVK